MPLSYFIRILKFEHSGCYCIVNNVILPLQTCTTLSMKLEPVDGIQYKLNIDLSFKFIKLRSFICDSAHDKFNARERERKKCQLACSFPFLLQTNEH